MLKFLVCILVVLCLSTNVMGKIDLTAAKLKEITKEHLYNPEYEFDSMDIYSIDGNAFTEIRKTLVILDLSYNKFTTLPATVFQGLKKITEINLGSNKLKQIDRNLFSGLSTLEKLKLKNCELKTLDAGTFKGLTKLQELDLSMNYLTQLDLNSFTDLKNLVELELQYNMLKIVDPKLFANTKKLKEISLDNNQLAQIDVNSINRLCLERLTIDHNKLTQAYDVRRIKKCMVISGVRKSGSSTEGNFDNNRNNANELKMINSFYYFAASVLLFYKQF